MLGPSVEGIKRLMDCLVASLPGIANVGGMIVGFVFVTSLFGLKMFKGLMRYACVDEGEVEAGDIHAIPYNGTLLYNVSFDIELRCPSSFRAQFAPLEMLRADSDAVGAASRCRASTARSTTRCAGRWGTRTTASPPSTTWAGARSPSSRSDLIRF